MSLFSSTSKSVRYFHVWNSSERTLLIPKLPDAYITLASGLEFKDGFKSFFVIQSQFNPLEQFLK